MKKSEQEKINNLCVSVWDECMQEATDYGLKYKGKLRSCTAQILETPNFYVLQSYNTLIACIDKREDALIDILRYVYGYTATSAKHIAKFRQDYGRGMWGCIKEYRYYNV